MGSVVSGPPELHREHDAPHRVASLQCDRQEPARIEPPPSHHAHGGEGREPASYRGKENPPELEGMLLNGSAGPGRHRGEGQSGCGRTVSVHSNGLARKHPTNALVYGRSRVRPQSRHTDASKSFDVVGQHRHLGDDPRESRRNERFAAASRVVERPAPIRSSCDLKEMVGGRHGSGGCAPTASARVLGGWATGANPRNDRILESSHLDLSAPTDPTPARRGGHQLRGSPARMWRVAGRDARPGKRSEAPEERRHP